MLNFNGMRPRRTEDTAFITRHVFTANTQINQFSLMDFKHKDQSCKANGTQLADTILCQNHSSVKRLQYLCTEAS
jgi:hypothetical protein